ncbi:MAG: hypothetical protein IJ770_04680 [Alphaproteobacteria bacterium]|nr:hypothetical protein [Alphaproteobacteria bacterium]
MFRLFKLIFFAVLLFLFAEGAHSFSRMHGGFGNMLHQFESELLHTAQLMLRQGTTEMQKKAEDYMDKLE